MVQIEAPSTPECQEGVPSQGGHSVVHHVQVQHYPCTINQTMNQTMNRPKIHEPWAKPWTINQGLNVDFTNNLGVDGTPYESQKYCPNVE